MERCRDLALLGLDLHFRLDARLLLLRALLDLRAARDARDGKALLGGHSGAWERSPGAGAGLQRPLGVSHKKVLAAEAGRGRSWLAT